MNHSHSHPHSPMHEGDVIKGHLRFGIILNLSFAALEVVLGLLSNSIAILTDAVHDFADSGSLLIAYIAARVSERPSDAKRSFGYRRVSILAALINSSVLLITTALVFYRAAGRLLEPAEVESGYMFVVAGISILVNGAAVLRIRQDRKQDLNLEGAFWHLLEDALGGISLFAAALIIHFTNWFWIDSMLSFFLGALVLRGTWGIVMQSINVFLEGTPPDVDTEAVEKALLEHPAVSEVHHLHIWAQDTNHYNMSVHVRLRSRRIPQDLYKELGETVEQFKVTHLTVQIEGPEGKCLPCDS